MNTITVNALTNTNPKIVNSIITPVEVKSLTTGKVKTTKAIWDTGATASVVTKDVAAEIGLMPVGMTKVMGVHGAKNVNVYYANITLNNKQISIDETVTECDALSGDGSIGMLIGMDIITLGDFAITNFNGQTVMTFRIPSLEKMDFVAKLNASNPIHNSKKIGRNDQCPCGSGKKYKHCCGKQQ